MNTALAAFTGAVASELQIALEEGEITPKLEAAIQAYASYWKKAGVSAQTVTEFVDRLIVRARSPGWLELSASDRGAHDDLSRRILERVANAYDDAKS